MHKTPYRIAVAGLGTVGLGLIELLQTNADLVRQRAGRPIEIIGISARNQTKDRGLDLSAYPWIDDPMNLPDIDAVDGVVELIGGDSGPALALARKTLDAGKDFITANKALLALHGSELAGVSEKNNAALAYEAAVAGAIPAIKVVRESLAGNRISKISGILNGTCNFILSAMESTGAAYADVLKEAQRLGYAEADPTTDVGGFDAAHKLTLLAALAFGQHPDFQACQITGIEGVSDTALRYGERLGYRIRLVGLAELTDDRVVTRVQPMAVPVDSSLGRVRGSDNAIEIIADQAGSIFLQGPGAGRAQTASAVAGDLIDLALGQARAVFSISVEELGRSQTANLSTTNPLKEARLCILQVKDAPGVMAALTQILAAQDVSVDQLLQPGGHDGCCDLAIITHPAHSENMQRAINVLNTQDFILSPIESYRLEHFEA